MALKCTMRDYHTIVVLTPLLTPPSVLRAETVGNPQQRNLLR